MKAYYLITTIILPALIQVLLYSIWPITLEPTGRTDIRLNVYIYLIIGALLNLLLFRCKGINGLYFQPAIWAAASGLFYIITLFKDSIECIGVVFFVAFFESFSYLFFIYCITSLPVVIALLLYINNRAIDNY
jgi:hypothetical protein